MTPEKLVEGHIQLMREIYSQEQYTRRKRLYVDIMKNQELAWLDKSGEVLDYVQQAAN
jgi:hypothetical protein